MKETAIFVAYEEFELTLRNTCQLCIARSFATLTVSYEKGADRTYIYLESLSFNLFVTCEEVSHFLIQLHYNN